MNRIIDIAAVIDSPSALTQEQGEKVYSIIADSMSRKEEITFRFWKYRKYDFSFFKYSNR